MQRAGVAAPLRPSGPIFLSVGVVLLASACASSNASGYAGGFGLTQAECTQSDSTVSCCLKQHPGDYERCGAGAPATQPARPNYLLPERPESESSPIPELPTQEERERWDKDICRPHYAKCIRAGGGSVDGRVWNETQCKACYAACMRYGYWPLRANEKPCPGA
jgi:hypothetical protein